MNKSCASRKRDGSPHRKGDSYDTNVLGGKKLHEQGWLHVQWPHSFEFLALPQVEYFMCISTLAVNVVMSGEGTDRKVDTVDITQHDRLFELLDFEIPRAYFFDRVNRALPTQTLGNGHFYFGIAVRLQFCFLVRPMPNNCWVFSPSLDYVWFKKLEEEEHFAGKDIRLVSRSKPVALNLLGNLRPQRMPYCLLYLSAILECDVPILEAIYLTWNDGNPREPLALNGFPKNFIRVGDSIQCS
jgi:hypothetical protein